ncbi:MAG: hypothetical protein ABIG29_02020 [Candidatus Nealsonbacteria bacterium]
MLSEIKEFVKSHQADIILVIGVVLISLLSFAMGYILAKNQEKTPLKFEQYETAKYSYYRSGDNRSLSCLEAFGGGA